jgi:hypothetical protein
MKKLVFIFTCIVIFYPTSSHAATPSVVIIDSGVNTSTLRNIVDEVCIVEFFSCPNNKSIMDDPNAATIAPSRYDSLNHGTQMASIIQKINPAVGLIPIRIVGQTSWGMPMPYTNNAVKLALDWVVVNQAKYNIVAVNVSLGRMSSGCQVPAGLQTTVETLKSLGVAVIAASGNDGSRTDMNAIACLPNVISVGATDNPAFMGGAPYDPTAKPTIANYSNSNAQTTVYTNGRWFATNLFGSQTFITGTSSASAAITGWWSINNQGSYQATYNFLISTTKTATNGTSTGRYVQIL